MYMYIYIYIYKCSGLHYIRYYKRNEKYIYIYTNILYFERKQQWNCTQERYSLFLEK